MSATSGNGTSTKDRWAAGVTPYAEMGYWDADYEPKGHGHPVRVPDHAPGGRRPDRGGGRRGRRVVDRHLDGGLDGPPDAARALPGQGLLLRRGPRHAGPVHREDRVRHRPLRGGVDREPDLLDHRQRLRLQGAQGAAARGHADPAALPQDLPGPPARDRDGARVPRQVRAPAARRHDEAQARAVGEELRPRRLRGAARRPRLHQGRREHQLAAVHALARPLPPRHRGREPRVRRDRRGQGPLHERDRRHDGGHVRAGRVRQGDRQRHHHDGPHRRLHGDAVDVQVGARQRHDPAPPPRRPRHIHAPEDPRRELPRDRQVVPDARRGPHPRRAPSSASSRATPG